MVISHSYVSLPEGIILDIYIYIDISPQLDGWNETLNDTAGCSIGSKITVGCWRSNDWISSWKTGDCLSKLFGVLLQMGMYQNQSCYIWEDEHPFTSYLGFTRVPRFWLIPKWWYIILMRKWMKMMFQISVWASDSGGCPSNWLQD